MISNYGGVGSVIETQDASIIIETFDKWGYPKYYDQNINEYIITDDRLLSRLKTLFPQLRHLVSVPIEEGNQNWNQRNRPQPQANYFPKWFRCTKCKRFMHYNDWKSLWGNRNVEFNLQCFDPNCKGRLLEQVHYVMTCENGHIHDLPWQFWNNRIDNADSPNENQDHEGDNVNQPIRLRYEPCCDNQELTYTVNKQNAGATGTHITCRNCGKTATLKGIFGFSQKCGGIKYWLGLTAGGHNYENCDKRSSVKIKSSNSIYYSNTLSSLWIPEQQILELTPEIRTEINEIVEYKDFIQDDLVRFAGRKGINIEIINQYLYGEKPFISDIVFREAEYNYFLNGEQPEDRMIKFRKINLQDSLYGFKKMIKIDRLKKITVQTSFTRNEPIDIDSILIDNSNYEYGVKRQSVSSNNFQTRILPAVENYGEGILFVMDEEKLKLWENKPDLIERVDIMRFHAESSDWIFHKKEGSIISPRKVLIHTLSHLLIREFEYYAGYPMSSLQERLFVNDRMCGFLISAYDGSDGYLGGLTKLCNNVDKLQEILQNALLRAKNCSLDPICYESEGQGVSQLNLAACHSCTLIPDTSCEMSNLFLDRRLLIDAEFGFFNEFLI